MKRIAASSPIRPAVRPPGASPPRHRRGVRIATVVLVALSAAGSRSYPQGAASTPPPPHRNIGGPGDYGLRERIVRQLGSDAELSKEKFSIVLVNGGAVFAGEIRNCTLKKRALTVAAATRGVINVTDEMVVPRGDLPDEALAKGVTSLLSDSAAPLELRDLDVRVADGVLTLGGIVKDVPSRSRAEEIAGTFLGITRIANHLKTADAPDGDDDVSLLKAVLAYLRDAKNFGAPSEITVKVQQKVVTLRGRVTLFIGRQQAGLVASLVRGIASVSNQIKVEPVSLPLRPSVQAER